MEPVIRINTNRGNTYRKYKHNQERFRSLQYQGDDVILQFNKPTDTNYQSRRAEDDTRFADIDTAIKKADLLAQRGSRNLGTEYLSSDPRLDEIANLGAKLRDEIRANELYLDAVSNPKLIEEILEKLRREAG